MANRDAGFDPFGWLARLFGGSGEDGAAAPTAASPDAWPPAKPKSSAGEAAAPVRQVERETAAPAATLPAEPASLENDSGGDDLRSGEVVARIWIAPFVDAGGVYREATHVRVVLEPAGWRLPR